MEGLNKGVDAEATPAVADNPPAGCDEELFSGILFQNGLTSEQGLRDVDTVTRLPDPAPMSYRGERHDARQIAHVFAATLEETT